MNRKGSLSLALCLLAAGVAEANEPQTASAPAQPATSASVPNIPPNLIPPDWDASPLAAVESSGAVANNLPQREVEESTEWAENPDVMPVRDGAGRVIFPQGSHPTIVCAPLKACDIELQPGEIVQGAPHIGDSVRWKIAPAVSGVGDQAITHLIIKPTEPGLDTNLIVPTDRGTYHIRLVSSAAHYVSSVAFENPEEQLRAWQNLPKLAGRGGASAGGDGPSEMPTVAVNRLNFNYKIQVVKGKPSFKPLRAMDDGYHTYIAMNEDLPQGEAPALIGISSRGEEQMVNYRLKGNLYVVDGTINKLALISGVGRDQQRIELTRNACGERGWLGICWDPKE